MEEDKILVNIRNAILMKSPPGANITGVEFEGPKIVIYSRNPVVFFEKNESSIKEIVKTIKKRVVIRGDPEVRKNEDETVEIIKQIVPPEAGITSIFFDEISGVVEIEAEKPGYVIGKEGQTLRRILAETLWHPRVVRTPPIHSATIAQTRSLFRSRREERLRFLRELGQRIHRNPIFKNVYVRMISLGGFQEVGRSAILVQTPESNILLDAGIKPSGNRHDEFPHFDLPEFNVDDLDAVVITHAHLDHCGALPYLYKYGYKGPVYTTEPTMYLMKLLQEDYLKIAEKSGRPLPYTLREITDALIHTYPLGYGEVTDIAPDVRLTLYPAGHILGSAMAHIHIGQGLINIVYTSDFKFERTKLLDQANHRFPRVEVLIMESTYGASADRLPSREETEQTFIDIVKKTVERNGIALIPVMAVGRAQEILLVLNEAIESEKLPEIPIFIEGMIDEATAIHTAFPEHLSYSLRERIYRGENPFTSPYIKIVKDASQRRDIISAGPSIIMATSGMLTGGPVLDYLQLLAEDPKNSLIFVSYQIEGTLGRKILKGLREIPFIDPYGKVLIKELKMEVYRVEGFSGHSDRGQLIRFLARITPRPNTVVLNHGEKSKIRELKSYIERRFNFQTITPQNIEAVRVR
ncbi:MAG: beta-CASP ribonuclease aCPSF1 [Thermoprotei archaeon]|nr:MAG: beta-CASP ribonuclease aCPSF1 [Thermoprotei archaeon]